nr:hypothetical protein [uncultured Ottowia sp.]
MPSHNTSSGVSASGGIMRSSASASASGAAVRSSTSRNRATAPASAMPAVQLIRNPTPMRASEAAACAASTPL